MKYLEYKDLENHDLSIKIFAVIQKQLNGRGNQYFDSNLNFDSLLNQLFDIYYAFYQIETADFNILKFKKEYKKFKKDSLRGEISITPKVTDGNITDRKVNYYSGEYTFYLVFFQTLFQNIFREQISEQKSPFFELDSFFQNEISSLRQAPNCHMVFDAVDRIMNDGDIDYEDFKFNVNEITELIKGRKSDDEGGIDSSEKEEIANLTTSQAIILLDLIKTIDIDKWDNLRKTAKAKLISLLISKNIDNVKKRIYHLDKKKSEQPEQFKKDFDYIETTVNQALKG